MECIVRGTPLPKVLWLKNNRPLKASDGCQVVADEETNMLIFPEVREDDVGVYTARAMNVNGSVMSSAELSLEDGTVKIVLREKNKKKKYFKLSSADGSMHC